MAHQCVHCGKIYQKVSKELLEGCDCGSHFFFFLKDEQLANLKKNQPAIELNEGEKTRIEQDVRDMIGLEEEAPVILDLESVRIIKEGKFEIDLVNVFNKKRPLVYKLEEGKYIIDLASTLRVSKEDLKKGIKL
ncbi:MAG TPA: Zn-ribbon containing protein [Candidatus Nanoarchaeia archaeon]|nr:Zn-ribbon containing protein [Candidatus Nanoarchaeia archaeon]